MEYIYLGSNTMIMKESIVGIFDLDNTSTSSRTRKFLSNAEKRGEIVQIGSYIPKTFIICSDNNENHIYLSQLSGTTLQKRMNELTLD